MREKIELFSDAERVAVPRDYIDQVAKVVGDHYSDETFTDYFSVYAGVARKYAPRRIFEIGVRYGYTGLCMLYGVNQREGNPTCEYVGIDDESYHPCVGRANSNFAIVTPWAKVQVLHHNSFNGLPGGIGQFDLIHIDAHHAYNAVSNELRLTWPLLNPGGVIILDDADTPGVDTAIEEFLQAREGDAGWVVQEQFYTDYRNHHLIRKLLPTLPASAAGAPDGESA